jgi:hypothetical protein
VSAPYQLAPKRAPRANEARAVVLLQLDFVGSEARRVFDLYVNGQHVSKGLTIEGARVVLTGIGLPEDKAFDMMEAAVARA